MSCDSVATHKAWASALGGVSFPLVSDFHPKGAATEAYGMMDPKLGAPFRAVFVIDKSGIVRWKKLYERPRLPDVKDILAEIVKIS